MNEAETRAELIDPALKAAGWGVIEASRVRREVVAAHHLQAASRPSSHIHWHVIIGYPTRDIPRLIEDVGDHRRRPGEPGEPIAMQLDPPKPIPRQRLVVCLNQPPRGIWPRGPMRRSLKIASDHVQVLRPSGVRDQDRQRRSRSFRALPTPRRQRGRSQPPPAYAWPRVARQRHRQRVPSQGRARWHPTARTTSLGPAG